MLAQGLLSLLENMSSSQVYSGLRVARSLVFCVVLCRSLFVLLSFFLLAIVLSVLRFKASDYPYGILKLLSTKSYICRIVMLFCILLMYS